MQIIAKHYDKETDTSFVRTIEADDVIDIRWSKKDQHQWNKWEKAFKTMLDAVKIADKDGLVGKRHSEMGLITKLDGFDLEKDFYDYDKLVDFYSKSKDIELKAYFDCLKWIYDAIESNDDNVDWQEFIDLVNRHSKIFNLDMIVEVLIETKHNDDGFKHSAAWGFLNNLEEMSKEDITAVLEIMTVKDWDPNKVYEINSKY